MYVLPTLNARGVCTSCKPCIYKTYTSHLVPLRIAALTGIPGNLFAT